MGVCKSKAPVLFHEIPIPRAAKSTTMYERPVTAAPFLVFF